MQLVMRTGSTLLMLSMACRSTGLMTALAVDAVAVTAVLVMAQTARSWAQRRRTAVDAMDLKSFA
ncbi:hypothetical protein BJF79_17855 [Actinomadura sp. CNU-125]|nr:hypothetical protein BJF79_17855 [Actinomadura sp. CNU-125]